MVNEDDVEEGGIPSKTALGAGNASVLEVSYAELLCAQRAAPRGRRGGAAAPLPASVREFVGLSGGCARARDGASDVVSQRRSSPANPFDAVTNRHELVEWATAHRAPWRRLLDLKAEADLACPG